MRVRLFVELDLRDSVLVEQFGANLANVTHQVPDGTARATETLIKTAMPMVERVRVVAIPDLL